MDSGTTHHLTSDLDNLGIHCEYQGPEEDELVPMKSTNNTINPLMLQVTLSVTIPPSSNNSLSKPSRPVPLPNQSLTSSIAKLPVSLTPSQPLPVDVSHLNLAAPHESPTPQFPLSSPARHIVTQAQIGSLRPKQSFSMSAVTPFFTEPSYYSQAIKHEHWRHAMANEYSALIRNGT
ncbi:hypothetical protein BC332_07315 [Capsicum chinense]|nr:hypothetical protein BC332_07315 [Capsicum chinense]